jgi:hypothetical protein
MDDRGRAAGAAGEPVGSVWTMSWGLATLPRATGPRASLGAALGDQLRQSRAVGAELHDRAEGGGVTGGNGHSL